MSNIETRLQSQVRQAMTDNAPLRILGGDSKAFYGPARAGEPLELSEHSGIVSYEPTELVVTVRAGTPLIELEQELAKQGQMLPFEPPHFSDKATIGGAVACGLAGPRRPWGGAPRDAVLGVKLLDGKGRILRFGGQVMKNVAGYDLSRLMAGSMGYLGVLLEVSLKVLPRPQREHTLRLSLPPEQALTCMQELAAQPLPLSGSCYYENHLYLRLPCSNEAACRHPGLGGAEQLEDNSFWSNLRDHKLSFFENSHTLWRLSVSSAFPLEPSLGNQLIDWGGWQRWLHSDVAADMLRNRVEAAGGHAEQFRHGDPSTSIFHPTNAVIMGLHEKLKAVFDPQSLFNRGGLFTINPAT